MLANSLLRLALDGRISMFFVPPHFTKNKGMRDVDKTTLVNCIGLLTEYWEKHPEVSEIKSLQDKGMEHHPQEDVNESQHSSSSEETTTLGPSTNRFKALLTISDKES